MYKDRKARSAAMKQLAQDLKVSVRTVRERKIVEKSLESVQIREKTAENARKHRENCEKYAEMVRNKQIQLKKAAFACGISERQMRRWVNSMEVE